MGEVGGEGEEGDEGDLQQHVGQGHAGHGVVAGTGTGTGTGGDERGSARQEGSTSAPLRVFVEGAVDSGGVGADGGGDAGTETHVDGNDYYDYDDTAWAGAGSTGEGEEGEEAAHKQSMLQHAIDNLNRLILNSIPSIPSSSLKSSSSAEGASAAAFGDSPLSGGSPGGGGARGGSLRTRRRGRRAQSVDMQQVHTHESSTRAGAWLVYTHSTDI